MSFPDLRSFLNYLEAQGDLVRVPVEVDPNQEVTIIQHRVSAEGGPALLFERIKGSPYRMATNLFGTLKRVEAVFGGDPSAIGEMIYTLTHKLNPPNLSNLWNTKKELWKLLNARLRTIKDGPIQERISMPPDLNELPVLTCWPGDGGAFFTLPLVHTVDPETGIGNLGIYRLQRYDNCSTGMHWQIEKGGGFHFHKASQMGIPLNVSVFLGGPPALIIAAIAPLPEGIDERLLAALIMNQPLNLISRNTTGHKVPATAEFVLEGSVQPGDMRKEGPFGDHFGHYSHSAEFPVFRVDRVLARKDAIYPATVVGKPAQEDFHIGVALQEMTLPLLKIIQPGICNLWAYPETGFHPLAVLSVQERYPREALKFALGLLGQGQMSLTKIMMVVDKEVDVRDFRAVSRALWNYLDAAEGLHLLAPCAQDTLDFTGPAMNSGSRLLLIATRRNGKPLRKEPPPLPTTSQEIHSGLVGLQLLGEAFLVVQVKKNAGVSSIIKALHTHPVTQRYLFLVLVSEDVPLDDQMLILWGWFTRFDPLKDLHPYSRKVVGNRLVLDFPIVIDATWKEGYPKPVEFDPEVEKLVERRWSEYGIKMDNKKW
jgi:UbiD family decarboxylase